MANIKAKVRLQIAAQNANPAPPVGTALGPHGIDMMSFCRGFNDRTKDVEKGMLVTTEITIFSDRTFSFVVKTPPTSVLLLKAIGIKSGSKEPGKEVIGKIAYEKIVEIAKIKQPDLTASDLGSAVRSVLGTARSMGLEVTEEGKK